MGKTTGTPSDRTERFLEDVDRRLRAVERRRGNVTFLSDAGSRAEFGRFPDGEVGLRVWDASNVLMFDITWT